ncbi:hypothetical protein ABIB60_002928 [Hymenobacter sp. UYP22]
MNAKTILWALLGLLGWSCNPPQPVDQVQVPAPTGSQPPLSPSLTRVVAALVADSLVTGKYVGAAGELSAQWTRYERLQQEATDAELVALTHHTNGVIRCYAFRALATAQPANAFSLLLAHLHDTAQVKILSGCIGGREYVGDYFVGALKLRYSDTDGDPFRARQQQILDSVLVHDPSIVLSARYGAITRLPPTAVNYQTIRNLVVQERSEPALELLARYRRPADKQLIASFFAAEATQYAALQAVHHYPDLYFYPFVKAVFAQEWADDHYDYQKWKYCYQALAHYPNPTVLGLFEQTVRCPDAYRREYLSPLLWLAIARTPAPLWTTVRAHIQLSPDELAKAQAELQASN